MHALYRQRATNQTILVLCGCVSRVDNDTTCMHGLYFSEFGYLVIDTCGEIPILVLPINGQYSSFGYRVLTSN